MADLHRRDFPTKEEFQVWQVGREWLFLRRALERWQADLQDQARHLVSQMGGRADPLALEALKVQLQLLNNVSSSTYEDILVWHLEEGEGQ